MKTLLPILQAIRTIASTWPFVVSVLVLIANDAWLKQAYPGLVSGKLSDFSGIAIVSLLLLAANPKRRSLMYGLIISGFTWWKSPLSQPVIDAINLHLPSPIGRTIDYTDLLAFAVIPICALISARPMTFAVPNQTVRRLMLGPVVALTTLGLMATSVMPTRQEYQVRPTERAADLDRSAIAESVAQVAAKHGLVCDECSDRTSHAHYRGKGVFLKYAFTGSKGISFEVEAFPNGIFFGAGGREKADRLRNDLKDRLASSYRDLEYIEQLKGGESR